MEIFDKGRPACLATDWSKSVNGFWITQKHCDCQPIKPLCCASGWRVTLVGSRFTSSTESRYAPIEGQALAVVDALEKSRHFVLGCDNLIIAVDHKHLVKVFGDRSLHDTENPRLRNLKEKTLRFRFRIVHVPGARNAAADSVSHNPVGVSEEMQLPDDQPTESIGAPETMCLASIRVHDNKETEICSSFDNKSRDVLSKITWESVRLSTASDSSCQLLLQHIEAGFAKSRQRVPTAIQGFFQYREHLSTYDGVILYKDRVVIPPSLRQKGFPDDIKS